MSNIQEQQKPTVRNPLFDFAYISNLKEALEKLKNLATAEKWDYSYQDPLWPYPILKNYLLHTFTRIKEEDKISYKDNYACFNTGLITDNQQEIFMLFKKFQNGDKWVFVDFPKESDTNMNRFPILPERAVYFTDHSELTYDYKLDLRINIDHIVNDKANFSRFPAFMQTLPPHNIVNTFNGAKDHALKRLKRNYKTAIPQYYRGKLNPNGQLQLLLPLCFSSPTKADLALAVYKIKDTDGSQFYSGRTCLTLDMAINNARLIAKPDDEWLKP